MAIDKTDSSVVMALSDLVKMEADRVELDRAREQRRQEELRAERERAEAAARDAERERLDRAEREAKVAEAEARLRLEADRERDQRIAAMRAELARVEADRAALRTDLEHRLAPREPARSGGWALAFGLSSLVAASLAALLVMQGSRDASLPMPAPSAPVTVAAAPRMIEEVAPVVAPAVEAQPTSVAATAPAATPRIRRHRGDHTAVDDARAQHSTDLVGLGDDDGGDDVLGPELAGEAHRALHH